MNKPTVVAIVFAARSMENLELAALNNAINVFGKAPKTNAGYAKAVKLGLLKEDGTPIDKEELVEALSLTINERVDAGTYT